MLLNIENHYSPPTWVLIPFRIKLQDMLVGFGPRACLRQNLAMIELRIPLALVLSNFAYGTFTSWIRESEFGMKMIDNIYLLK